MFKNIKIQCFPEIEFNITFKFIGGRRQMRLNEASTSLHTQPSGIRELFIHFLRQQKSQSWLGRHRPREGGYGRANVFPCKTLLFLPRVRMCREPSAGTFRKLVSNTLKPALTLKKFRVCKLFLESLRRFVGVNSWLG